MRDRQETKTAKGSIYREPSSTVDALAREVIGAAIEVHRQLGPGFGEAVYEEALALELSLRELEYARQPSVDVWYKGRIVGRGRPDFVVADQLVIEIKAVTSLAAIHQAQVISYLKALDTELGLLLNFKQNKMRDGIRRVIRSDICSYRQQQASKIDKACEARQRFVVPSRNPSVTLEIVKEDLDAIA